MFKNPISQKLLYLYSYGGKHYDQQQEKILWVVYLHIFWFTQSTRMSDLTGGASARRRTHDACATNMPLAALWRSSSESLSAPLPSDTWRCLSVRLSLCLSLGSNNLHKLVVVYFKGAVLRWLLKQQRKMSVYLRVCAWGRAGQGMAGQGRAGQGRAGQGRAGQGRAGQGRAGQGRAGQGRAGLSVFPLYVHIGINLPENTTTTYRDHSDTHLWSHQSRMLCISTTRLPRTLCAKQTSRLEP